MLNTNLEGAIAALESIRHHIEQLDVTLPNLRVIQEDV